MAASSVDLPASFERHLRAENKSARMVETYPEAVLQLDAFLGPAAASTWPAPAARTSRRTSPGCSPAGSPPPPPTATGPLRVFYAWLEDEGEIPADPMAKMKPPRVPEQPAPVLTEDMLRRLLGTCAGRGFEARRDRALILLLLDTGAGARRSAACGWAM